MSRDYHQKPSQTLRLKRLLKREQQFDPDILVYCFDRAVLYFGHWIEAKLSETDSEGNLVNAPDDLLGDGEDLAPMSSGDEIMLLKMKLNRAVGKPSQDGLRG